MLSNKIEYTKEELVKKLDEQQKKLNAAIECLIGYASKGWNKKPAEECLEKIGVKQIIYTYGEE